MNLFSFKSLAVMIAIASVGCSPIHVEEAARAPDNIVDQTGLKHYDATVTIPSQQTRPVDILWVIDNSGSMTAEAAHVRNNFSNFINSVKAAVDLKVGLISKAGTTGNYVSLPVTGPQYLQIDQIVGSHDSLMLTASALCPTTNAGAECSSVTGGSLIRGQLRPFFRQNSKKVLVFVTDDNSTQMTSAKFKAVWNEVYGSQDPFTAYGFLALSATQSPCMAAVGSVYMQLTQAGGQNFNICDTDWTSTFSKLTNNVLVLSLQPIALPSEVKNGQIVEITLNGQVLNSSQYTISHEGLVLSPTLVAAGQTVNIHISYQ